MYCRVLFPFHMLDTDFNLCCKNWCGLSTHDPFYQQVVAVIVGIRVYGLAGVSGQQEVV
jgi:hypothetical protein